MIRPSYTRAYRLPHSQKAVVEEMIQGMLKENIIQESCSPWNSPMFLIKEKKMDLFVQLLTSVSFFFFFFLTTQETA